MKADRRKYPLKNKSISFDAVWYNETVFFRIQMGLGLLLLLMGQPSWGQVLGKDRLLFPYGRIHRHLGFLVGIWYEDIRWWELHHRTRMQVLAGFNGGMALHLEQNVPYPTPLGVYHRHSYVSSNSYEVRYLNGQSLEQSLGVEGLYSGEVALYYRPHALVRLMPGMALGVIDQSTFQQGPAQDILEVAAKVQATVGSRSFHPEEPEGYIDLDFLRVLNRGSDASRVEARVGGQVPWLDPHWVLGSQMRVQWAPELANFWFFRPYLGGVERLSAFYELSFLDYALWDMNVFMQWRVYEGALFFGWIRQISLVFMLEGAIPLGINRNEFWDSVSLGSMVYLKNERRLQVQAAVSPSHGVYAISFSARQWL